MRSALICLSLALATLAAQAAPAPLPKRSVDNEELELASVQTEFARLKEELADRGVSLYDVRRGQWRREWIVRYLPESSPQEDRGRLLPRCGGRAIHPKELRVEVEDNKQFGQALRDALARLKRE
jgi:hypothetical protein